MIPVPDPYGRAVRQQRSNTLEETSEPPGSTRDSWSLGPGRKGEKRSSGDTGHLVLGAWRGLCELRTRVGLVTPSQAAATVQTSGGRPPGRDAPTPCCTQTWISESKTVTLTPSAGGGGKGEECANVEKWAVSFLKCSAVRNSKNEFSMYTECAVPALRSRLQMSERYTRLGHNWGTHRVTPQI